MIIDDEQLEEIMKALGQVNVNPSPKSFSGSLAASIGSLSASQHNYIPPKAYPNNSSTPRRLDSWSFLYECSKGKTEWTNCDFFHVDFGHISYQDSFKFNYCHFYDCKMHEIRFPNAIYTDCTFNKCTYSGKFVDHLGALFVDCQFGQLIEVPPTKKFTESAKTGCPKCGHVGNFIRMSLCCPRHGFFAGC